MINAKGLPERYRLRLPDPTLMPWSTVFGNVFRRLLQGLSERHGARIAETLALVGLSDFADATRASCRAA